jgi:hypothetical protein
LGNGVLVHLDFTGVHEGNCVGERLPGAPNSDYEIWEPSDVNDGDHCLLGRTMKYIRRKRDSKCIIPSEIVQSDVVIIRNCTCALINYECDYCFEMNVSGLCEPDPECGSYNPHQQPDPCDEVWYDTQGYRKVPGDSCDVENGVNLLPIRKPCVPIIPTAPVEPVTPTAPITPAPVTPPPVPVPTNPVPVPVPANPVPVPTNPVPVPTNPVPVNPAPVPTVPVPTAVPTTPVATPTEATPEDDSSRGKIAGALLIVFLVLIVMGVFIICILSKTNATVYAKLSTICPADILPKPETEYLGQIDVGDEESAFADESIHDDRDL